jgi:hypothetical protein
MTYQFSGFIFQWEMLWTESTMRGPDDAAQSTGDRWQRGYNTRWRVVGARRAGRSGSPRLTGGSQGR